VASSRRISYDYIQGFVSVSGSDLHARSDSAFFLGLAIANATDHAAYCAHSVFYFSSDVGAETGVAVAIVDTHGAAAAAAGVVRYVAANADVYGAATPGHCIFGAAAAGIAGAVAAKWRRAA
jgi:hypothetical protein